MDEELDTSIGGKADREWFAKQRANFRRNSEAWAVSDAVASAHLSGVDVPADHVETLGAVARGEVTADDAVKALVDGELRDRIADVAFDALEERQRGRDVTPVHTQSDMEAVADAAMSVVAPALGKAYLDGHDAGYAHAKVPDPWAKTPAVDELRDRLAEVLARPPAFAPVEVELAAVAKAYFAPMLAAKDEALAKMRLAYEGAMFKVHAWEQNSTPAGNALADLAEARRLLRQRNVAYGRASATIGVLRGTLARYKAARTALDTARGEHAHDEEELRRQLLDVLGDGAQTEAALRVVLPVLVAHEYTEDQALAELNAVKANAVTLPNTWTSLLAETLVPGGESSAFKRLVELINGWRGVPSDKATLWAEMHPNPPRPDTEATEQARTKPVMEVSGWCERCGCDVSGENHYHCAKCGQRTSMMGHRDGCPPVPAPAIVDGTQ